MIRYYLKGHGGWVEEESHRGFDFFCSCGARLYPDCDASSISIAQALNEHILEIADITSLPFREDDIISPIESNPQNLAFKISYIELTTMCYTFAHNDTLYSASAKELDFPLVQPV